MTSKKATSRVRRGMRSICLPDIHGPKVDQEALAWNTKFSHVFLEALMANTPEKLQTKSVNTDLTDFSLALEPLLVPESFLDSDVSPSRELLR